MRKTLIELLECPITRQRDFHVFARQLRRGEESISDVGHEDILDDDEVEEGFISNPETGTVFPITERVLIMLADSDVDPSVEVPLLQQAASYAPATFRTAIEKKIGRLKAERPSETGDWCRDEMRYYDKAVATPELRADFLREIRNTPLWGIFLERQQHLIDQLTVQPVRRVLEIGCGNSRTVSWIYPPGRHGFSYVGTDISLQRLILAKQAMPEGDFIQCSALNLPLRDSTFDVTIAFGVLHHLPDPTVGLQQGFDKLRPGGQIVIHEPIEKPKQIIPESGAIKDAADRIMLTYEHSEHDNELRVEEAKAMVDELDGSISYEAFSGSVLRTALARFLFAPNRLGSSKSAWSSLIGMDRVFGKLACRKPNRLGPNAIFLVVAKSEPR